MNQPIPKDWLHYFKNHRITVTWRQPRPYDNLQPVPTTTNGILVDIEENGNLVINGKPTQKHFTGIRYDTIEEVYPDGTEALQLLRRLREQQKNATVELTNDKHHVAIHVKKPKDHQQTL
ncbi:hypothetical protein [Candidatus Magnetobacterium casense]|uniref:Uncharacterized protein n=1 Tax=Candidatus Magnetobacterium casense TaxID=1455061 RepID=A0ABS6S3P8_9BACT|nr:hypothetical protein [Candidatus Magnetobacterium casensis]MBV6343489.1 hypothetical protein [Candidatus Magnetobacterium casensis]